MIFNALVTFAYSVASFIIGLAPNVSASDTNNINTMHTMFAQARALFNWVNFFFPIDTLFLIIGLIITIQLVSFISRLARWIASILTVGVIK